MQYSWFQWRASVVAIIQFDFGEVLRDVRDADIDWDSWRTFYDEGRSPQAAVDCAFLRDLRRSGSA
ncbi:hypothetical protein [Steroidobacter cummioxidans]|uniref:hypothetical protein n=1 Tax=Steroidobacter cummioxidans TaxID=1803913 RepID=UPI000E30C7AB|nr:hypothetical protein [Steroidobacter cummioxidans]